MKKTCYDDLRDRAKRIGEEERCGDPLSMMDAVLRRGGYSEECRRFFRESGERICGYHMWYLAAWSCAEGDERPDEEELCGLARRLFDERPYFELRGEERKRMGDIMRPFFERFPRRGVRTSWKKEQRVRVAGVFQGHGEGLPHLRPTIYDLGEYERMGGLLKEEYEECRKEALRLGGRDELPDSLSGKAAFLDEVLKKKGYGEECRRYLWNRTDVNEAYEECAAYACAEGGKRLSDIELCALSEKKRGDGLTVPPKERARLAERKRIPNLERLWGYERDPEGCVEEVLALAEERLSGEAKERMKRTIWDRLKKTPPRSPECARYMKDGWVDWEKYAKER